MSSPLARCFRIEPTQKGRKCRSRLDERVLVVTTWLFLQSAILLAEGSPPADVPEMQSVGAGTWALPERFIDKKMIDGGMPRIAPQTARPLAIQPNSGLVVAGDANSCLPRLWPKA